MFLGMQDFDCYSNFTQIYQIYPIYLSFTQISLKMFLGPHPPAPTPLIPCVLPKDISSKLADLIPTLFLCF